MGRIKMEEPKVDVIPVKFDIWDTHYTVRDYGSRILVEVPRRKYGRGGDRDNWTLGHYSEDTTNPESMEMIRLMVKSGRPAVFSKEGMALFSMEHVIAGIPLAYGWRAEDFE